MKSFAIVAVVVLVIAGSFASVSRHQNQRALMAAEGFCDPVKQGEDIAAVVARANALGLLRHGPQDGGRRYVALFPGAIFNACLCEITVAEGRVTGKKVRWLDD